MKKILVPIILCICFLYGSQIVSAQKEREVIIIERTLDQDGKEISRKTVRKSGHFSDEEIEDMINDGPSSQNLRQRNESLFDLKDNRGHFDGLYGGPVLGNQKIRLGVRTMNTPSGLQITSVQGGSIAAENDIRDGDIIIAIDDILIATNEDVTNLLDQRKSGDKIKLMLLRGEIEIQKDLVLKPSQTLNFFFENAPDIRLEEHFGQTDLGELFAPFRELFEGFDNQDLHDNDDFNDKNPTSPFEKSLKESNNDRAGLGAFVEMGLDGVEIIELMSNGSAKYSGLLPGDILLELEGKPISSIEQITSYLAEKRKGDIIRFKVNQKGTIKVLDIHLR